jgi:hypothetical protein
VALDILFLCHGRLEFTRETLPALLENTDWELVDRLVVYNDAATDGHETTKFLMETLPKMAELRKTNLRSPVGVMNHFMWRSHAEIFAKVDNDIMVPPGWLEAMLGVMEGHPDLELLGMAAAMSALNPPDETPAAYDYMPASNIGGVGLMRKSAFERHPWPVPNGRFGFTEWQHRYNPVRGWIEPDLRVFEIDKIPFNPWQSITSGYKAVEGLQRDWSCYPSDMHDYWDWAGLAEES